MVRLADLVRQGYPALLGRLWTYAVCLLQWHSTARYYYPAKYSVILSGPARQQRHLQCKDRARSNVLWHPVVAQESPDALPWPVTNLFPLERDGHQPAILDASAINTMRT